MSEANEEQQTEAQVATEKEARVLGWVPKEEFRDGDHWVDADAFVKRGKEINPILRKNNEILLKKLDEAKREIDAVKKVANEFGEFQKEATKRKVADLENQLLALKEQKKLAIKEADGEAVVDIEDAIAEVKAQQVEAKQVKPEPKQEVVAPVALDPIITKWMEDNTWFTTDNKLTRIADIIGADLNITSPELKGKAFFDQLDKELENVLPEKYKKKPRGNPVEGNTSGGRTANSKKHSFDNLPKEAQQACDRMIKQGFKMTRDFYVAEYDWSDNS